MPRVNVDLVQTQYRRTNDFLIGEMGRQKKKQADLAEYLGVTQPTISLRMKGDSPWPYMDLLKAYEFIGKSIVEAL